MGSEAVLNGDGTRGSNEKYFKSLVTNIVVPETTTAGKGKTMNPSHLDHFHMDRYVPLLLFYRLADNSDATYQKFADNVKHALAQALVVFYPMAGRVHKTKDLDHPRQFVFNDEGMPFSEAVLDAEMSSFFNPKDLQQFPYLSGFERSGLDSLKQVQAYEDEEKGNVPAFVQVTRFNCGGIVVAFTWNHMVADMTGAVQFLTAWCDISRTGKTTIAPYLDRSVLNGQHETSPAAAAPVSAPPAISAEEAARIQEILNTKFVGKSLHIRRDAVAKLKAEAVKDYPEVSTMDCLCAHLWRCVARVNAAEGVTDTTVFTTAVEGRSRMEVSPFYFGNIVSSASVNGVPAAEINSQPSVGFAASLIRKAVKGITKETYWKMINQMDLRNPWKTGLNRTSFQLGVASWVRFGLNDLEFGVEKLIFVGVNLPAQNSRKGQCIILPSALVEGDYYVQMYVVPRMAEILWSDAEFTSLS